jgi:hypothetical protein
MIWSIRAPRIESLRPSQLENEGQHRGLRRVLARRDRLGIDVDGGSKRRMPQQLLHDFEFRPYAPQQRRVSLAERVPANPLLDFRFSQRQVV